MAFSKAALVRNTLALVLVGLLALGAIIGATWFLVQKSAEYSEEVLAERRARASLVDLLNLVQQAESSQRGFLIKQQPAYLQPYHDAIAALPRQIQRARENFAITPERAAALPNLQSLVEAKLRELSETVALAEAGNLPGAYARVGNDDGVRMMNDIRTQLGGFVQGMDQNLARLAAEQRAYSSALRYVSIGGGLLILLAAAGAAWTVFLYMKELASARSELESLNSDLEMRVRERTEELASANEEIQRFAYIVTHDLRAPLVNIMGFTSELQTSLDPLQKLASDPKAADEQTIAAAQMASKEDLPEAIDFIRASTRKMDGLINAILRLSREGRRVRKPELVDLTALAGAAAAAVQHQVSEADGDVAIDLSIKSVITDRLSLEQIVGNMLDNAVKYRDRSRPLRVAIRSKARGPSYFTLEIEDNGRGIAPQDHDRIFELFRRSGSQDQAGEGIGLAHVKALVRSLGGTITVASALGQGTTFSIHLPRDLRDYLGKSADKAAA